MRVISLIVFIVWSGQVLHAQADATAFVAATIVQGVGAEEVVAGQSPLVLQTQNFSVAKVLRPSVLPTDRQVVLTSFSIIGNNTVYAIGLCPPPGKNFILQQRYRHPADLKITPITSLWKRDVFEVALSIPAGDEIVGLPQSDRLPEIMINFN